MVEYTAEELEELRTTLGSMGGYLAKDKTGYIWNNYKRITGSKENQPCTCPSSGKLWQKAINAINTYLKEN
jgi:hypothetical protein